MGKKDARVNAYIVKAAPFARPILKSLRRLVHAGCPQVQETIKWGFPHFEHHGLLCAMGAFKNHCAFWFWNRKLVLGKQSEKGMAQFGRITSVNDLPSGKTVSGYVRKAAKLNEAGIQPEPRQRAKKRPLRIPPDLRSGFAKNSRARKTFEQFTYTQKKEYLDWLAGAKRVDTRQRRLRTAVQWMSKGKPHNWRYL